MKRHALFALLILSIFSATVVRADPPDAETILADLARTDARARQMLDVLRAKKRKFPNLAAEVEMLIFQIAAAEFFPRTRAGKPIKPIVIVGPPSIGKTTMIREIVGELGLEKQLITNRVGPGERYLNFERILLAEGISRPTGVQAIYFADEIQNLEPTVRPELQAGRRVMSQVDAMVSSIARLGPLPEGSLSALLKTASDAIQQLPHHLEIPVHRGASDYLLWHLTGNGIVQELPFNGSRSNVAAVRSAMEPYLRNLRNYPEWLESLREHSADRHAKYTADPEKGVLATPTEDGGPGAEAVLRYIATRPHLFGELLRGRTIPSDKSFYDVLLEVAAANPVAFANHVLSVLDRVGLDRDVDAGRVIVILSGNDQDFQDRVKQRVRERGGSPENPADYHRASQELLREEGAQRLTEAFLERHLGTGPNRDALMSRLATTGHKPSLSESEVRNLVAVNVRQFERDVVADLRERGVHVERFEVDERLVESMFQRLKRFHQDPRRIVNEIGAELSLVQFEALPVLLSHASAGPGLAMSVTPGETVEHSHLVRVESPRGTTALPVARRAASTVNEAAPRAPSAPALDQQSVNRAGFGVVASLLYGSVPRGLALEGAAEGHSESQYQRLDVDSLRFRRNEILGLLAGMAAETEFTPDLMPSERAVADRVKAEQLLQGLLAQLRELKRQRLVSDNPNLANHLEAILPGIAGELVFREIDGGQSPEAVLQTSLSELRRRLRQNRLLVTNLAADLRERGALTGEQMQPTFHRWLADGVSRQERERIASNEPGSLHMELCTLVLARTSGWSRFTQALGHRLSLLRRAFVGG